MIVTVFGGSQPQPGDSAYQEAYDLGRLLGVAGHTVMTGGYIGTMEAASRGASEAGGHVVGVTCAQIESWRPVKPNAWVKEERRFATLNERLQELIHACDAAVALPGGPGTLTEIALTWNLMIVADMPPKPLILIDKGWQRVFDKFCSALGANVPPEQWQLLSFVENVRAAVAFLQVAR